MCQLCASDGNYKCMCLTFETVDRQPDTMTLSSYQVIGYINSVAHSRTKATDICHTFTQQVKMYDLYLHTQLQNTESTNQKVTTAKLINNIV